MKYPRPLEVSSLERDHWDLGKNISLKTSLGDSKVQTWLRTIALDLSVK